MATWCEWQEGQHSVVPGERREEIGVKEKMKKNVQVVSALELVGGRGTPHWMELNSENVTGKIVSLPKREDINMPIQERMIVELYSK